MLINLNKLLQARPLFGSSECFTCYNEFHDSKFGEHSVVISLRVEKIERHKCHGNCSASQALSRLLASRIQSAVRAYSCGHKAAIAGRNLAPARQLRLPYCSDGCASYPHAVVLGLIMAATLLNAMRLRRYSKILPLAE